MMTGSTAKPIIVALRRSGQPGSEIAATAAAIATAAVEA